MIIELRNLCEKFFDKIWYESPKNLSYSLKFCYFFLKFFSLIYLFVVFLRKKIYKVFLVKNSYKAKIWVVGNLTVGGNGKSIIVGWLANYLIKQGYKVAIVSKGYNRNSKKLLHVNKDSKIEEVGDEPLMLSYQVSCIILVANSRALAFDYLDEKYNLDYILCDDGLQDYTVLYDKKFLVINNNRMFGNKALLPSGPLREPIYFLDSINAALIVNFNKKDKARCDEFSFPYYQADIEIDKIYSLSDQKDIFDTKCAKVNIVTAIADHERFVMFVKSLGFKINSVSFFADHYVFCKNDFAGFSNKEIIFVSEKDAVKCKGLHKNIWVVAIKAKPDLQFIEDFL